MMKYFVPSSHELCDWFQTNKRRLHLPSSFLMGSYRRAGYSGTCLDRLFCFENKTTKTKSSTPPLLTKHASRFLLGLLYICLCLSFKTPLKQLGNHANHYLAKCHMTILTSHDYVNVT